VTASRQVERLPFTKQSLVGRSLASWLESGQEQSPEIEARALFRDLAYLDKEAVALLKEYAVDRPWKAEGGEL